MNKKDIKQSVLVLICIIITALSVTLISNAVTTISTDITTGGNVGIGTTTPNWSLQTAGTEPAIALTDTSAGVNDKHWLFQSLGGNLFIGTSTDNLSATSSRITIDNNGNVGVGTTTPAAELEVSGTTRTGTIDIVNPNALGTHYVTEPPQGALNIYPYDVAAIYTYSSMDLAYPVGQNFQVGEYDGATFTERLRISGGLLATLA